MKIASAALLLFLGTISQGQASSNGSPPENQEMKLMNDIIYKRRIDRFSRPVQHHNHTLLVEVNLLIFDIMGLDERSETFGVNGFMRMKWKDYNLTWNPADYGDLTQVNIPDFFVWKPDIVLLSSTQMRDNSQDGFGRSWINVVLNSNGSVRWSPPVSYQARCPMDLRRFPFDEHDCSLTFGSWSYYQDRLNITFQSDLETKEKGGKRRFLLNKDEPNEWEVFDSYTRYSIYEIKSNKYPMVHFHIRLRRRAPYYRLTILAPSIVMMAALLAVFWLPPNAGEKITLSSCISLILTVLLVHLYWVVPRSGSSVPGIVLFCGIAMVFSSLSLVLSVITITLSRSRSNSPAPSCLKNVLTGPLGIILCLGPATSKQIVMESLVLNEQNPESIADEELTAIWSDWILVATAIDRIFFYLYCVTFAVLLPLSFS